MATHTIDMPELSTDSQKEQLKEDAAGKFKAFKSSSATGPQPVEIQWVGLSLDVPASERELAQQKAQDEDPASASASTKRILHDLSGVVGPGELVAIMGPSGSGKTSLLNVLAQRSLEGVTGEVLINGEPPPPSFRRLCGYVTQDETWFNTMTVRESLTYAAELRLPYAWTTEQKMARVERVIDELDLGKCQNTFIGEIGEGISGGERRRLAIGLQILSEPSLLLLDEPTSGLDAASALMVITTLQRLAAQGRTVITTIHQPRFSALKAFTKLILLGDGKIIYSGSVDNVVPFFSRHGFKCPEFENPSDFILDAINQRQGNDRAQTIDTLHTAFLKEQQIEKERQAPEEKDERLSGGLRVGAVQQTNGSRSGLKGTVAMESQYPTPFLHQCRILLIRSFYHKLREPIAAMTQGFNSTILPFIIGTLYWQLNFSQAGAENRVKAMSLMVLLQSFMAFDILLLFPVERKVYLREQESGLYRTSAYYLGRTFAELPLHIFWAFCTACISYWCIGFQNDASKFLTYCGIVIMATLTGSSLLLFLGSISRTMEQSNMLATLVLILFMLFDGNWIAVDSIPAVYKWIRYLSFNNYAVQSSVASELRGLTFTCDDATRQRLGGQCPYETGEEFLELLGFSGVNVATDMWYLFIMNIVYRFLAYLGLRFAYTGKSFRERLSV